MHVGKGEVGPGERVCVAGEGGGATGGNRVTLKVVVHPAALCPPAPLSPGRSPASMT
jgi:hypothetical protein